MPEIWIHPKTEQIKVQVSNVSAFGHVQKYLKRSENWFSDGF
jgi:hypothetical protein